MPLCLFPSRPRSIRAAAALPVVLGLALGAMAVVAGPGRARLLAPRWVDASGSHLPAGNVVGRSSMAAEAADLDGDGDADLVLAVEFGTNVVLRNEGGGHFVDATPVDLRRVAHDSEDIALADFTGDGRLDLVFVSEDDRRDEYYLGDGAGGFTIAPWPLPTDGVSNAVLAIDLDGDGDLDLVIGNNGANAALVNDGSGRFSDATAAHLPMGAFVTQDIGAGDLDGDGDVDLVEANEDDNRILLNDGAERFAESLDPALRYPVRAGGEETRVVTLGDVDGDADLDLVMANVVWSGVPGGNRLLLNDGHGRFADAPAATWPQEPLNSIDADLADIDDDGDLDVLVANAFSGANAWRVLLNDGHGAFSDASAALLPRPLSGNGVDVDAADLDGDGRLDLYLANHSSRDVLLLSGIAPPTATNRPPVTATAAAAPRPATPAASPSSTPPSTTEPGQPARVWLPLAWAGLGAAPMP